MCGVCVKRVYSVWGVPVMCVRRACEACGMSGACVKCV